MTRFNERVRSGGRLDRLNPYRVATRLILDRLFWDLKPLAWRSRRKLCALKDSHAGEKAVILCNGPSLRAIDFKQLENVFTFGLNKINLLFEEASFRPSAIVAVNPLVVEQNLDFFKSTTIPLFIDRVGVNFGLADGINTCFMHSCDFPHFSRDCSLSIFQGYTVTYVALQLAYHMGFTKVALVGCDHDYQTSGEPNTISIAGARDLGHFSDKYFANQPWQLPDLAGSEFYYDLARRCFEHDGRTIVNASTASQLNVFHRMALNDFVQNC
jgi:hypothetical protein